MRPAEFVLEDKPVLTLDNSLTSKRPKHTTGKCPEYGADIRPSSKYRFKYLSARHQKAFCEAHKRKDKFKAAKAE